MKRIPAIFLGLLIGLSPMLMAPSGGIPAQPRFQKVTIAKSTQPSLIYSSTSGGADGKNTVARSGAGGYSVCFSSDAAPTTPVGCFLSSARTATAVTNVSLGNATDNPSYSVLGTGTTTFSGAIVTNAVNSGVFVNGAAGTVRDYVWNTAGSNRWISRVNVTAEGGANAGSDYELRARTDAGADIGCALCITRSSLAATFGGTVTVQGFVEKTKITGTTALNIASIPTGGEACISGVGGSSRASTTTSAIDADFQFTNAPIGEYEIRGQIRFTTGAGGFRWQFAGPSGNGGQQGGTLNCAGVGTTAWSTASAIDTTCASATGGNVHVTGNLQISGAGTIGLLWAQQASNVANSTRASLSYLCVNRVN